MIPVCTDSQIQMGPVLDMLPAGVCVIDRDYRVVFWNARLADWTGICADYILDRKIGSVFPSFKKVYYRGRIDSVMELGVPVILASTIHEDLLPSPLPNGENRVYNITINPTPSLEGQTYALISVEDITEQNRLITELQVSSDAFQRSEAQVKSILESTGDAIRVIDLNCNIVRTNAEMEKLSGVASDSSQGKLCHELFFQGTCGSDFCVMKQIRKGLPRYQCETVRESIHGKRMPVEMVATPLMEKGQITGIVESYRDISERKESEEKIREATALLSKLAEEQKFILDNMTDFVYKYDSLGLFSYVSSAVTAITGYTPEEWKQHYKTFITSNPLNEEALFRSETDTEMRTALRTYRMEVTHKKSHTVILELCEHPYIEGESVAGYIGVARDISERIQFEQALQEQAAHLERSNNDLDDFGYIISHDLKEPLRGIKNYSQFINEDYQDTLDSKGVKQLQTLIRLSDRMEDLIDNLLEYSRMGRIDLAFEKTNISDIIGQVLDSLQVSIEHAGVRIKIQESIPAVECDKVRVAEVFRNLLTNALKYTDKEDKRIEIGCVTSPHGPAFFVRDNGIGIEKRHTDQIFKIFKRLHGRNAFGGGTGAGLTIVQKIIDRHNGKIWLESTPKEGTTFYFTLGNSGDMYP